MFFCLDYLNYKKTKISTPTQRCGAGAGRRRTFWLEPEPEPEKKAGSGSGSSSGNFSLFYFSKYFFTTFLL